MADKLELRKQRLFSDLSDNEVGIIADRIVDEVYTKGKVIFKEGDSTKGIYLVKNGRVEISKNTPDGWKQTLAILTDNQIFGELAVIAGKQTHGADAMAIEPTHVYCIKLEDFKDLEKSNTLMMYKIMKSMANIASRNVHTMNEKLMKLLISY